MFYFVMSGRDVDGAQSYSCSAPDDESAIALARASGLSEISIDSVTLLDQKSDPQACLDRIENNPLLGSAWIPMAFAICDASESVRRRGFWRMDTLPSYLRDHGPAPYVQGLTEWDGRHYLEVGGYASAPDWSNAETSAALELFGWTGSGAESRANLTLYVDSAWTGMRIAETILSTFVVVYGFDLMTPVTFAGSATVRDAARAHLEVLAAPDIFISPRPDQADSIDTGGPDKTAVAEPEVVSFSEPSPELLEDVRRSAENHYLDAETIHAIAVTVTRHVARRKNEESIPRPCDRVGRETLMVSAEVASDVLIGSSSHDDRFELAGLALGNLARDSSHIDRLVSLELLLEATHPLNSYRRHEQCGRWCVLRHTATRAVLTACSADPSTRFQSLNDSCVHVRSAVTVDDYAPPVHPLERHAPIIEKCGVVCESAWDDLIAHFTFARMASPELPSVMTRDARRVDPWFWGSQPRPSAIMDYHPLKFSHLLSEIPDQFAFSHSGYGINSWSLNARVVIGSVALHAQTLWGGAYSTAGESDATWAEIVRVAEQIGLVFAKHWDVGNFRKRRWLITYSDFRDGLDGPRNSWNVYDNGARGVAAGEESQHDSMTADDVVAFIRRVDGEADA